MHAPFHALHARQSLGVHRRYPAAEVRVVDEAGDIVKRRLGAADSWETPRAPFEACAQPRECAPVCWAAG